MPSNTHAQGWREGVQLVGSFQKNLYLKIISPPSASKIKSFDHKWQNVWFDHGFAGPDVVNGWNLWLQGSRPSRRSPKSNQTCSSGIFNNKKHPVHKSCAVQAEGVQYRLRVCSTGSGYAVRAEGMQYRLRVCSTGWGCAARAEGVQYGLRVCSTGWGCAVRAEGVQYKLRHNRSTGWRCAVQAEGVQYGLKVCSIGWGCAVQA